MIQWKQCDAAAEEWDSVVSQFDDANPFQCWGWGELKRVSGWKPVRFLASNGNGQPVLAVQVLSKGLPARILNVVWMPGGPLLRSAKAQPKELQEALAELPSQLKQKFGRYFSRMNSLVSHDSILACSLASTFRRPMAHVISGFSIVHSLQPSLEELQAKMTSKHRYYLKAAQKAGLVWKFSSEPEDFMRFWTLLTQVENAKKSFRVSVTKDDLGRFSEFLPGKVSVLSGSREGNLASGCLVLHAFGRAYYLLAATGTVGREVSAAYEMVFELWRHLKAAGVERFDFGGIAPGNAAARGVDHFKRGFGGQVVEYLGEWETSSPALGKYLMNPVIFLRSASA